MADHEIFDVIVVGAGPAGEVAAARAVRNGLTAAIIDRRLAGGECHFYGCVPSKAMLWPMELADGVGRMPGVGLSDGIDAGPVLARRDKFVDYHDDAGQVSFISNLPATFVRGKFRACCTVHAPSGCAVTPRTWTWRVPTSIAKNTYTRCEVTAQST